MNVARELILWIADNTTLVVGSDLHQGVFPVGDEDGIALTQIGGDENETKMQQVIIHISVQKQDYDTADSTIQTVWDLLSYNNGMTLLDSTVVHSVVGLKFPSFINVTEHNKYMFTCSVVLHLER